MKKKLNKIIMKNKVLFSIIIVALFIFVLYVVFQKNDGMEQSGLMKIYYRVYTSESGWSRWCKNGLTCGNKKENIKSYEVKSNINSGILYYKYSTSNGWENPVNSLESEKLSKRDYLRGIRLSLYHSSSLKYDLCYRTYNKKNKWLDWNCDGSIGSGNKKENISAIEIKIIPKNVIKNEYLRDYGMNNNDVNIGL